MNELSRIQSTPVRAQRPAAEPVQAQLRSSAGEGSTAAPTQTLDAVRSAAQTSQVIDAPTTPAVPIAPQTAQASIDDLQKAVERANQSLQTSSRDELRFKIDDETGVRIVTLTDKNTGEVIRQIPSKEMLEIAKSIDKLTGRLFNQEA